MTFFQSEEPTQFSRGINLSELLNSNAEFHLDMDFQKKKDNFNSEEDLFPVMGEDESEEEDILKVIEETTDNALLSTPEYQSFEQLATKMVDCVSNGDVKILIIEEGDGPLVPVDAEVTFHYAGYWEKQKISFDSSVMTLDCKPKRVRLGAGNIIPGLDIGLTMVKGPKARFHLLLQPAAAFGDMGALPRLKPEPALFVVVLLDVKDNQAAIRFNDLPKEEQCKFQTTVKTIKALREDAKDYFKKAKYYKAIKNYQMAMSVLSIAQPETEDEMTQLKDFKVKIYVNLIVCYHKVNKPKYILRLSENLDYFIDINTNCKVQFYRGRAFEALGNTEQAIIHYKKALSLEPKNTEIGETLSELDNKTKLSYKNEKDMWRKVFKADVTVEEKTVYDVDEEFRNGVVEMCEDLAGRNEYAKFNLPNGLTRDEVDCMKSIVGRFEGILLEEEGSGDKKRISIIKK